MRPGDQLLCALVRPLDVGDTFDHWPLHVTLVPWFRLMIGEEEFLRHVEQAISTQSRFTAKVGHQAAFGSRFANVLEKATWQPLHDAVLAAVKAYARSSITLRFVGKNFQPHVTVQRNAQLHKGEEFLCDTVYVIMQCGTYKKVIGKCALL